MEVHRVATDRALTQVGEFHALHLVAGEALTHNGVPTVVVIAGHLREGLRRIIALGDNLNVACQQPDGSTSIDRPVDVAHIRIVLRPDVGGHVGGKQVGGAVVLIFKTFQARLGVLTLNVPPPLASSTRTISSECDGR